MRDMKKLNALLAFAAAACLVLAGCGGADDDDDDDSEEKKTKVSASSAADEDSDSDSKDDGSSDDASDSTESEAAAVTPAESEPDESIPDVSAPDSTPDTVQQIETPKGVALSDDMVIGEWSSTKMVLMGSEDDTDGGWKAYLYEDKTGVLQAVEWGEQNEFSWQITGTELALTDDDGDIVYGCIDSSGALVLYDEDLQIFFELASRVPGQPPEIAEPAGPPELEAETPSETAIAGKWKSSALYSDGEYYDSSDPFYGEMIAEFLTIEIKSGGKGTVMTDDNETEELEWKIDGDEVELTVDGDSIYAVYASGKLVLDLYDDGELLVYMDRV